MRRGDGFVESDSYVVTWCVGHLVTMSYPEVYDPKYKRWSLNTLPFLPDHFLYEVIPGVKKQYQTVSHLLNRKDVDTIYVCTDSGREGEYIYRLVEQMAEVKGKTRKRVWIDSQTEEEIHRGIREAKDLSAYDNLASAAYLRAKEDYLMGINFSRLLTLKYGNSVSNYLGMKYSVISVGRVMTCVLGMIVRREREIRRFVKTPFYRVIQQLDAEGRQIEGEFRAVEGSRYFQSPKLYKENGFKEKKDAEALVAELSEAQPLTTVIQQLDKKKEKKIRRFCTTLPSCRTTARACSRSARTRPCASCRSSTRKSSSPIRVPMPVCSRAQWQRRSGAIFPDCKASVRQRDLRRRCSLQAAIRRSQRPERQRQANHRPLRDHPDRAGLWCASLIK